MTSLSTTTTTETISNAAASTTRLSWEVMKSCRWPQPELSIGVQRAPMDILGRYKCWEIKDKSPAHAAWKALSKLITSLIRDQYEHLNAKGAELLVEMFMIGRNETKSSPTLLISCEIKPPRQLALKLIHKNAILADYPGILMAECSRFPRQLALDEPEIFPVLDPGVYLNGPLESCGISVLASVGHVTAPRKATLGGIVRMDDQYFALTVAHTFRKAREPETATEVEFAFYRLGELNDSSDEEDSVAEMTSHGSTSSDSLDLTDDESILGSGAEVVLLRNYTSPVGRIEAKDETIIELPPYFGALYESSPSNGGSSDWALITVEHSSLSPFDHGQPGIMVNKIICHVPKPVPLDMYQFPRKIAPAALDTDVFICTGRDRSAWVGILSGTPSFLQEPGSGSFCEMWTVHLLDKTFVDGDCGSWVVDSINGALFGIVISGYPGTGTAYIAPAFRVFRDIQTVLGRGVELSIIDDQEGTQLETGVETPISSFEKLSTSKGRFESTLRNHPEVAQSPTTEDRSRSFRPSSAEQRREGDKTRTNEVDQEMDMNFDDQRKFGDKYEVPISDLDDYLPFVSIDPEEYQASEKKIGPSTSRAKSLTDDLKHKQEAKRQEISTARDPSQEGDSLSEGLSVGEEGEGNQLAGTETNILRFSSTKPKVYPKSSKRKHLPSPGGGTPISETKACLILPDPHQYRSVIGKGGSTIFRIREATGCKINVPRDQMTDEGIMIVGTSNGVKEAEKLILLAVHEDEGGPRQLPVGHHSTNSMSCPVCQQVSCPHCQTKLVASPYAKTIQCPTCYVRFEQLVEDTNDEANLNAREARAASESGPKEPQLFHGDQQMRRKITDINPPGKILKVSNLPFNVLENELRDIFAGPSFEKITFEKEGEGPVCLVEFEDIHSARAARDRFQGHFLSNSFWGGLYIRYQPSLASESTQATSFTQVPSSAYGTAALFPNKAGGSRQLNTSQDQRNEEDQKIGKENRTRTRKDPASSESNETLEYIMVIKPQTTIKSWNST